jgi:hypothetical protein
MKPIRAIYENGKITPIEPVPDVKSAEVLVIFPEKPEPKKQPVGRMTEAELFGCGVDLWTDEVDAAVREVWKVRTRPPEFDPEEGF